MPTDINRNTTNVVLPEEVSAEIWAKTVEDSAIMQLARKVAIPGPGMKIQTITGEPEANWVGETEAKPVSVHTFGKKDVIPYKLAVIEPFSEEFVRDKAALYQECLNRAPKALARKFDTTVMGTTAPGTGFDTLGGATKVSLTPASGKTVYDQFLAADAVISAADGIMTGIGLAPQGKSKVLGAVDGMGRPLFTAGVTSNSVGDILGAPVSVAKGLYVAGTPAAEGVAGTPATVGIAGDFENAVWGSVEGIKMKISDQATLVNGDETINLWQLNMVGVLFEIEVAFAVKDIAQYALLTE